MKIRYIEISDKMNLDKKNKFSFSSAVRREIRVQKMVTLYGTAGAGFRVHCCAQMFFNFSI